MKHAELIAVGSELLTSYRSDTNSLWITEQLNRYCVTVTRKHVIGDDRAGLADLFREAGARSELVIATGGLGPTFDDITRETLAEAVGVKLDYCEEIYERIEKMFAQRRRKPTENNRRQAFVPRGGRWFANSMGTAPGLLLRLDRCVYVLLPGPPTEMKHLFPAMEPEIFAGISVTPLHTRKFKFVNIAESVAESLLIDAPLPPEADWSILAAFGQVEAHLRVRSADEAFAEKVFSDFEKLIVERIGRHYFGTDDVELEEAVGALLRQHGHTIAVAESCTGGWLSQRITAVAGSSEWFLQAVVTYSYESKEQLLGVVHETIARHGAVSRETALEMARGIRSRSGASVGVSITGIAGPGGGMPEKPVGTVFIAAIAADGTEKCHRFLFRGDREKVRFQATQAALDMVRMPYFNADLDSGFMIE